MSAFLAILTLSLDSLVVAFGLAPLVRGRAGRYGLATWFGLCDALGSLASTADPVRGALSAVVPHLAALGLIAATLAVIFAPRLGGRLVAVAVPVLLSMDNLSYPLPPETTLLAGAVLAGVTSAALALTGICLGALIPRQHPAPRQALVAAMRPAAGPLLAALVLTLS